MCVCAVHDWETGLLGSLRSCDGFCSESVTSKLTFMVDFAFCDHSILVMLYERGGVTFRLLSTNSFDVKAENERYTSASWSCRHNLIKTIATKTCRTCSTIMLDFPYSTNQIIDLWCWLLCCHRRRRFLNSLLTENEFPDHQTRGRFAALPRQNQFLQTK